MNGAAPLQTVASRPLQNADASPLLQRKCACGAGASTLTGECEECSKKKIAGLQTKLRVNKPGDAYEQEADRIAEQVLAPPAHAGISSATPRIQRFVGPSSGQGSAVTAGAGRVVASLGAPLEQTLRQDMGSRFGHDFSSMQVHSGGAPDQSHAHERLTDWLPQTRGTVAERATVHQASPVADRAGANAVSLGQTVHLSSGLSRLGDAEQHRVLAHEAVHIAQRFTSGTAASRPALEMEAHRLTGQVLAGHAVRPQFRADPTTALADDGGPLPGDRIAVAKAKARREILLRYKAIYDGSTADVAAERKNILEKRERLDASMATMLAELEQRSGKKGRAVEEYQQAEQKKRTQLNTKPLSFEITPTAVRIRARFQVQFEGMKAQDAEPKFRVLEQSFQKGVQDTWNQTLAGSVLSGRKLELIPELKLVSDGAVRDQNFWLITVRPTDKGPIAYGKTTLGTAPGGVPTSATVSELDGGVMSIPPSHIKLPETLGHETLHLFGLVDRYAILPAALSPTKQDEEVALRATKGRSDPLGAEGGKILDEDLGYVLDELGIYPSMPQNEVLTELSQVEEIIKTGRDPKSLIRKRQNFEPEMVKQTQDLD